VELVIPPLRERRALIGPLAQRFLEEARLRAGKPGLRLGDAARAALEAQAWPGNVRELKAVIERAVLLATTDQIEVKQLAFARPVAEPALTAPAVAAPAAPDRARDDLSEAQRADRDRVQRALDACAGNQTRAAKQLGISRTTLVTKLGLYRIRRPRT